MSTKRNLLSAVVAAALWAVCGCASFRGGHLERIASWPPQAPAAKKSVSVLFSGEASFNGRKLEANTQLLNVWRNATLRAYQESALFSEVKPGAADADLRAEIKLSDEGSGSLALAFVTGLTFYVIPSSATDRVTLDTTLRDREGKVLGTFKKSETVRLWQQLFLIFVTPFKFPPSVARGVVFDLSRATLDEAVRKGYL